MVRRSDTLANTNDVLQAHDIEADNTDGEESSFDFLAPDDFSAGLPLASVRAFVAWAQQTGILDTGELPDCWDKHPALVDLLSAITAARYGGAVPLHEGSYGRALAQWWQDWTALRELLPRWTDSCQRQHTPD